MSDSFCEVVRFPFASWCPRQGNLEQLVDTALYVKCLLLLYTLYARSILTIQLVQPSDSSVFDFHLDNALATSL